jgi:methionine-rich copper-binding protein CopC
MKTPTHLTLYRREETVFNHLTLYLLLPSLKVVEDFDYDTLERGLTRLELDLPTSLRWNESKDHWTVSWRVLGLGFTLTRQEGY